MEYYYIIGRERAFIDNEYITKLFNIKDYHPWCLKGPFKTFTEAKNYYLDYLFWDDCDVGIFKICGQNYKRIR